MDARRILVTAGTGVQGTGVVEHCLQAGHTVHALVRNAASEAAQNLQRKGVFLVQGDYDNLDVLKQACQNVDAVFLNVVPVMHDPDQEVLWAQNVITASKSSGKVSHFYYSSVAMTGQHESFPGWGPHHPQYGYWISKNRIEGLVRDAGFPHWTILRPAFFMQNFYGPHTTYMFQDIAEKHVFRTAIEKETRLALVDGSEVGKFVAAALCQPSLFDYSEISLASQELTPPEIAAALSRIYGSSLRLEYISGEELKTCSAHPSIAAQIWVNQVGYKVDIEGLQKYGIYLRHFPEYLAPATERN